MSKVTAEHFHKVKVEEFSKPRTGMFNVYVDYWWEVTKEGEILFFQYGKPRRITYVSPQCNKDEKICRALHEKRVLPFETDVVQLPVIFVPFVMSDYV